MVKLNFKCLLNTGTASQGEKCAQFTVGFDDMVIASSYVLHTRSEPSLSNTLVKFYGIRFEERLSRCVPATISQKSVYRQFVTPEVTQYPLIKSCSLSQRSMPSQGTRYDPFPRFSGSLGRTKHDFGCLVHHNYYILAVGFRFVLQVVEV